MKRFILSACVSMIAAAPAFSADYPSQPRPQPYIVPEPAPAKTFDWSRCYAGLQAGTKIVDNRMQIGRTDFYVAEQIKEAGDTLTGPVIGGQIGCNQMFAGGWLAGVELEGLLGYKDQVDCSSQVDPVARCIELKKRHEAFVTARLGYVVDNSFLCDCLNGLMIYGRAGVGFTQTDVRMNVNTVAYYTVPAGTTAGGDVYYAPQYAQDYNLSGSRMFYSPVLGFGIERAIAENWTFRADMTAMVSMNSKMNMKVTQASLFGATEESRTPGAPLAADSTGLIRNPRIGDILPTKMREIETRLTFGVNRLF